MGVNKIENTYGSATFLMEKLHFINVLNGTEIFRNSMNEAHSLLHFEQKKGARHIEFPAISR